MNCCIKKYFNQWIIDEESLKKQLIQKNIDLYDYSKITKKVTSDALNNIHFLNYLIGEFKKSEHLDYSFKYVPEKNVTMYLIELNPIDIKEFFIQKKYSNILIKNKLKKLIYYTSEEYINKNILSKKVMGKLTYNELIKFLKTDPSKLDIVESDRVLGYYGPDILFKLMSYPIYLNNPKKSIFKKIKLTEKEWNNIYINYKKIKDVYELDYLSKTEFESFRGLVDGFELNPKLEKDIIEEIPKEFNKLQQVYFIYKRLCQKFTYDEEYFCLRVNPKEKSNTKHSNIEYFSEIKGGEDIICTEISLIFAKFLDILQIPFQILNYSNKPVEELINVHMKTRFKVDNYIIDADGATGLYMSDMFLEKVEGNVKNFQIVNGTVKRNKFFIHQLEEVDEYLYKNKDLIQYKDAKEAYKKISMTQYSGLSPKERIDLLIDIIDSLELKIFDIMGFVLSIYNKIFEEDIDKCAVEFIINKEENLKLNILLIYNDKFSIQKNNLENNYIIITHNFEKKIMDYKELKSKFENGVYDFTEEYRNLLNLKEFGEIYEETIIGRFK